MKRIFLSIALVAIASCSFGQWTTSGTNIYNSNTGNIGVGTTNPLNVLNIIANKTTDAQYQSGLRIDNSPSSSTIALVAGVSAATNAGYVQTVQPNVSWTTRALALQPFGGNVGIGTESPTGLFSVGSLSQFSVQTDGATEISTPGLSSQRNLFTVQNSTNGAYTTLTSAGPSSVVGTWIDGSQIAEFVPAAGTTGNGVISTYTGSLLFQTNYRTNQMIISPSGNVGIGTSNPDQKLSVNGTIHSKSVVVDLNNWPDYVFRKEYQLPSLTEVKTYIDQNHHLPDMPSAQEIADKGLNLGEMNKQLTKKVEELTLYLIEKDKKEKEQEERIRKLELQMQSLMNNSKQ